MKNVMKISIVLLGLTLAQANVYAMIAPEPMSMDNGKEKEEKSVYRPNLRVEISKTASVVAPVPAPVDEKMDDKKEVKEDKIGVLRAVLLEHLKEETSKKINPIDAYVDSIFEYNKAAEKNKDVINRTVLSSLLGRSNFNATKLFYNACAKSNSTADLLTVAIFLANPAVTRATINEAAHSYAELKRGLANHLDTVFRLLTTEDLTEDKKTADLLSSHDALTQYFTLTYLKRRFVDAATNGNIDDIKMLLKVPLVKEIDYKFDYKFLLAVVQKIENGSWIPQLTNSYSQIISLITSLVPERERSEIESQLEEEEEVEKMRIAGEKAVLEEQANRARQTRNKVTVTKADISAPKSSCSDKFYDCCESCCDDNLWDDVCCYTCVGLCECCPCWKSMWDTMKGPLVPTS